MMDDIYAAMDRINEIKKRFGLMRHNVKHKSMGQNNLSYEKMQRAALEDTVSREITVKKGTAVPEKKDLSVPEINSLAKQYSDLYRVPHSLVQAVIKAESGYNPNALSPKGSGGLMQLMPGTARELGVKNVFSPEENIAGGTKHLKSLLEEYNGDYTKALAAYNAGKGAVDKAEGVPDYPETKAYINKVIDYYLENSR